MHTPKTLLLLARRASLVIAVLMTSFDTSATAQAPDMQTTMSALTFREIGPALMGGRISSLAVVESKPQFFYLGTATGGLWKTENHGTSWTPLFDDQPTSTIGDVTIDQNNPNLVWVGSGEPQNRQSSPWGNGVYKSTDGGASWSNMGLEKTKHIGRMLIHPRDPETVYVAAVGDLWAQNPERGVYRTRDGGVSWERVLYIDENTGAIDLVMDPNDPSTLFAAMYQRRRTGFGFNGGGPGSGIYRTMDGGENWTEMTEGLPEGDKGRIGLDVYQQNGNVIYALIEADARSAGQGFGRSSGPSESGLFRSADRGTTWEKMSDTNPRPMYYSQIRIDPSNPDRIYVLGTSLMVSDDAGRTFRSDGAAEVHVDHHDLWINPKDPDHLILGSDGGVSASWDGTAHWRMFDNLALGQFYTIAHDMRDPYYVCGGLQDNNPWCGPSNTRSFHGIRHYDWYETAYGDGFWTVVDPTDSTIVFSESQGGNMNRYDLVTGEKTPMRPITGPRENGDTAKTYRFNWNAPLMISRHDPSTILLGGNYLMRSPDRGMAWVEVGGLDLTKQIDRDDLEIMGVPGSEPMMSIHDGISTYGNLTVLGESQFDADVIYAGTDDGNVQVTMDGGESWTNVVGNIPGLPERTYVSRLAPSAHEAGRVYATFDGHRNGDYSAYVYVSENYGQKWRRIDGGLPDGWSVNVVIEHHRAPDLLFVGNEIGIYVSVDRGESWTRMKNNFPTVPVDDLVIHPRENDLIVGTHGRSAWILEDLAPLEHLSQEVMASTAHMFPVRNTTMWAQKGDWPFYGASMYSAPNPPRATRLRYYIRDEVDEDAQFRIVIADAEGNEVRTFDGPYERGINEILWDWRYNRPYDPPENEEGGGPDRRGGGPPQGPIVMPGSYTVTIELGDVSSSETAVIEADPRRPMTLSDRMARQDVLISLHQLAPALNQATLSARRLGEQFNETSALLEEYDGNTESLLQDIDAMQTELEEISDGLGEARSWAGVANAIQGSSTLPTEDQLWQADAAWDAVPPLIERLNTLITEQSPAVYSEMDAMGIRPSPGDALSVPRRGN
ncbi:hypothetical protein OAJ07_00580 [Gemmatimonadales bacterium]|nr:hypothetical protein [Gemmatimonadales bacterium]